MRQLSRRWRWKWKLNAHLARTTLWRAFSRPATSRQNWRSEPATRCIQLPIPKKRLRNGTSTIWLGRLDSTGWSVHTEGVMRTTSSMKTNTKGSSRTTHRQTALNDRIYLFWQELSDLYPGVWRWLNKKCDFCTHIAAPSDILDVLMLECLIFRWVSENIMIPCLLHKKLDRSFIEYV